MNLHVSSSFYALATSVLGKNCLPSIELSILILEDFFVSDYPNPPGYQH
jgi:hypothetical protein